MQTLTNESSPLLSTLSSPNVQKALEKASPGDIAQISELALQLQSTDALFGASNSSTTPADALFAALANVDSASAGSTASESSLQPGSPLSDLFAAYQGNMQTQETQTLFGTTPSGTQSSFFDVFA
jgi:hypothetical protein